VYSHAAWAESLGGISLPLLSDFQPKGAVADSFGLYLADKGITDRATVIIDAGGTVRHVSSVTPAGKRDIAELAALCEQIDASFDGSVAGPAAAPAGLPDNTSLYVKDHCMFSRWALSARKNMHLDDGLPVTNVSRDAAALEHLQTVGGKGQAPALVCGSDVLYESKDIIDLLVKRTQPAL